jgi:hypothetical protein
LVSLSRVIMGCVVLLVQLFHGVDEIIIYYLLFIIYYLL